MKKSGIKKAGAVYTVLIFIVLYLPILIMQAKIRSGIGIRKCSATKRQ